MTEAKKPKLTSSCSSSVSVSNCEIISDLPGDLLPEIFCKLPCDLLPYIFCRLPVKSLCRFKSVSKSMYSMIQSSAFVEEKRSIDPPFVWDILFDKQGTSVILTQTFYHDGSTARIRIKRTIRGTLWSLRRCNGLIAFYNDNNKLLLCNLTKGVMIHVPTIHGPSEMEHFAFGFDSSSKKFKVLVWMEDEDANFYLSDCHIRTLGKDSSWRPLRDTPQFRALQQKPQVNVNGSLFWFDARKARIISFDLADETFGIIKLPGEINLDKIFTHSMFEFEGYLCLVEMPDTEQERFHFEIINLWILKNIVSQQWVSMVKNTIIPVEDTNLYHYYTEEEYAPRADISARNGEILIAAADGNHQYIFLYSFLNGKFKPIRITGLDGMQHISVKNHVENHVNMEEFGERVFLYNY